MDDFVDADTPQHMKACGDRVRAHILDLVLEQAMTVTELAGRVGRSKGTVAHHVDVLVGVGLLKVVRTRQVRAMEERFYGRTGRTIVFHDAPKDRLPFVDDANAEADFERMRDDEAAGMFTLRRARIPPERVKEWVERIQALALEFVGQERGGDTEFALYLGLYPTTREKR